MASPLSYIFTYGTPCGQTPTPLSSGEGSLSKPPNMDRMQTLETQWGVLGINKPQQEVITLSPLTNTSIFYRSLLHGIYMF